MASKSKSHSRVKDMISDLPDSLLCHILSFMPTKDSVSTSVLSSRWKRVWASVPSLDFRETHSDSESFVLFVSRVLYFRNSSDIQKFKLKCYCVERFSHIDGWIRTAIMHNLVELDLCVEKDASYMEDFRLELPKSLFMCKTLVKLNLSSIFIINPPTSWCLPHLRVLFITVKNPGSDLMENLLPGCPALEDFSIFGNVGEGYLNFNISALELKKLQISLYTRSEDDEFLDYNDFNIFVTSPKLEYFGLDQSTLSKCVLGNSESFVEASIDLDCHIATEHPAFAGRVTPLMAQICNVKYLSLSAHDLHDNCELPIFDNLKQLKLVLHRCCSWWAEFLKRSPNLESLVLEHVGCNCDGLGGYGVKEEKLLWHHPELVPNCQLSHVKTICIKEFLGRDDEFEVAKYLLKNGEVLNSMNIYTGRDVVCTKEEMLEKLLKFERVSKTCDVEIA
ncbi:F-box/LRR-repeat protein At4g14103-like [Argentina anserina]|uniref:F-box/LRR-repeat protein At4g14103-like n=1 Tax=Argentina anserina TaxID=57926 RepID=UPI00217651B7|nr:F-box/LRR-repeat protein At4g14103-like [Potentilla anserina]XP_050375513.1 F-box/LRR-repeat protein At4g14103-like [Potentilla anserina]